MKNSKSKKAAVILSCSLVGLALGTYSVVPAALAGKAGGELIDAGFEEAMLSHFEKRFFKTIEADDSEKTALRAIFIKQMQSSRSDREALRRKMLDLCELIGEGGVSDEQIKSKLVEVRGMREKIMDSRLECALKVRQILTPEQRKIVGERISNLLSGGGPMRRRLTSMVE